MNPIYVDSDACPVIPDVIELSGDRPVHLVCNRHHEISSNDDSVTVHCSSDRADGADYYIYNHSNPGDIVVTDDLGLAALVLGAGCHVVRFRGERINNDQIEQRLLIRHTAAKSRRAGHKTKGPPPFTPAERERFRKSFKKCLDSLS